MKPLYFKLLSIFLISCLGIITYSNTFHCSFHFDDRYFIFENSSIKDIHNLQHIWAFFPCRFITLLSIALNYHFHQLDVYGYHLFNLGAHLLTAILVWWLTLLTLSTPALTNEMVTKNTAAKKNSPKSNRNQPIVKPTQDNSIAAHADLIALLVALVFVSHPVQTEAVTYIWQRAASLVALFYIASLCFYIKSRSPLQTAGPAPYIYYIISLMMAVLAMFTKENAVTLPLMILLYEFYFLRTKKDFNWFYLIPFLLTIFIIPLTISMTKSTMSQNINNVVEGSLGISPMHYLFTQFRVIVTYIRLIFIPINQNLDYDYPVYDNILELPVLASLLFLIAILYFSKRLFLKYRLISFSILWFFLTLLPESSILPLQDVIYEHRLYLPLVGYSLFLVSGLYYGVRFLFRTSSKASLRVATLILLVIIACNSVLTYQRNKIWKDELTLLNDIIPKSPFKARPYNNRGKVYLDLGDPDQAIVDLNKAIELDPHYVEPHVNRGLIYDERGNFDRALADYNSAVELDPHFAGAYDNRGDVYNKLGNLELAVSDYNKAIELNPNFAEAFNNRGNVLSRLGNLDQAIADFTKAIELNPTIVEAYSGRGLTWAQKGNFTQAMIDLDKAIELNPMNADTYYSRGLTYARHNDTSQAMSDFSNAIKLKSNDAEAYNNRGFMYSQNGDFKEAIEDYSRAIESDPKLQIAYINRAYVFYKLGNFDSAWEDINDVEKLGATINPGFLRSLKIESGRDQ